MNQCNHEIKYLFDNEFCCKTCREPFTAEHIAGVFNAQKKEIAELKAGSEFYSVDQRDAEVWALEKIQEEYKKNPEAMDEIQCKQIENSNGFVFSLWKNNRPILTVTGLRTVFNGTTATSSRNEWKPITKPTEQGGGV